jgi:hypothetical protein
METVVWGVKVVPNCPKCDSEVDETMVLYPRCGASLRAESMVDWRDELRAQWFKNAFVENVLRLRVYHKKSGRLRSYKMDSRFIGKAVVALMSSVPSTNCVTLFNPMPHPECSVLCFS